MTEHTLTRDVTTRTGYEYELSGGKLKEVHDWWVDSTFHRFECSCGDKFNTEEKAIEHLQTVE